MLAAEDCRIATQAPDHAILDQADTTRARLGHTAEGALSKPTQEQPQKKVLVLDDQEAVRDVVLAQLESLGHNALSAGEGALALELLRNSAGGAPVDVLLVDYAMPGMSGDEVVRAARRQRPDLAVVLMTGYTDPQIGEPLPGGVVLLKKPFKMQELATALAAASDQVAPS